MRVDSQRVADLINANLSDATAWMLRRVIDDAQTLLSEGASSGDLATMLKFGSDSAASLLDMHASIKRIAP